MAPIAIPLPAIRDLNIIQKLGDLLATEMCNKKSRHHSSTDPLASSASISIINEPYLDFLYRFRFVDRNFESLSSDDTLLGGQMAAGTKIRHFTGNYQKTGRLKVHQQMEERRLRELHLVLLHMAARKLNLRMSGIVPSEQAGMNLEKWWQSRKRERNFVDAVTDGFMKMGDLDTCVSAFGANHRHPNRPEEPAAYNLPEHRTFLEKTAGDGIAPLQNNPGLLSMASQLSATKNTFVSPNTNKTVAAGRGCTALNSHYHQHSSRTIL
ncbi:hypothetical protein BZA77DRAFT_369872 [Pyronema omphalodes]|nr:hypothetical protein BZA77DRAFT_369872 [Pyronema omphalodes]